MMRIAGVSARRRQAEQALHRMATSDALTGLPNRTACLDRLTAELADGPDGLAVLFGDLDGFKPVNDRLGHAAGDALLVAVADRLRAGLHARDLVSRFGGDEFVVICRAPARPTRSATASATWSPSRSRPAARTYASASASAWPRPTRATAPTPSSNGPTWRCTPPSGKSPSAP
jgi:GGDEF domain-containing protein